MRLNEIRHPAQLRALSSRELEELAQEIRDLIVRTVTVTGGHLASSLGVVELTLALLTSFDPEKDRIVWDVGHQCYAFKILTGRRDRFHTLRQLGGISGFPLRSESPCDAFGAGHASTSLSAALGFAKARDLKGEDHRVVAVIGDGALTGGMAWEAINNAGVANTDLLVVLNDNEMSISRNVGALARHTSALRSLHLYQSIEENTERLLEQVPLTGQFLVKAGRALKRGVTHWISPEHGALFEALGFDYIGPIDGHNVGLLTDIFAHARNLKGPVLMHVITKKGRGCDYAESDARRYHGVSGCAPENGEPKRSSLSYSQVFGATLCRLAEERPEIVAITAAMPDGTGLTAFAKQFPERCFDVGIAEEHGATFAAGLAAGGIRPVIALYSSFLQRAYDQVIHDVCLQKLPVLLAIDRAGLVGQDGPTHHGIFDIAFLRHVPNLTVMAPRGGAELQAMLAYALQLDGPCAIRYPRDGDVGPLDAPVPPIEHGKAELLREGSDLAFIAPGDTVARCLEAAALLEEKGLSAAVVNARFIKPLDAALLAELASRCQALVTVEEHVAAGGFGSAVLEMLNAAGLPTDHVLSIALPDHFPTHGDSDALRARYGLDAPAIADRALRFLREKRAPGE
mgnify:CR=1 FL=1